MIRTFGTQKPEIHAEAWVADDADVIGDVAIGPRSSVWFQCVVRGDVHHIRIGRGTNIQDHSTIHVSRDRFPTIIGDEVTVGHRAVLHACTVESAVLVGIGAIVLDGAVIGEGALIGAMSLVTPGMRVPPGKVVMGVPGKVMRDVTEDERKWMETTARSYVEYAKAYRTRGA